MRTALLALTTLACGIAAGYLLARRPEPPVPDRGTVEILHISDPAASPVRLVCYRSVVDGKRRELAEPQRGADVWRVNLADGRVVMFCSR